MRNVPLRAASLCVAFLLLGRAPAIAQNVVPTPQEEERAREALRAGLDNKSLDDRPDEPSPFDPHSAKTWEVPPLADIAPGLHAHLFQPSTEILSVTPDSNWLPGTGMPQPEEEPQEDRAATASAPDREAETPTNLATPPAPRQKSGKSRTVQKKMHSLRSGRASLDEKSAPAKKPRRKTERPAPKAPTVVLPGELQP